jgi:hypothetical protein
MLVCEEKELFRTFTIRSHDVLSLLLRGKSGLSFYERVKVIRLHFALSFIGLGSFEVTNQRPIKIT